MPFGAHRAACSFNNQYFLSLVLTQASSLLLLHKNGVAHSRATPPIIFGDCFPLKGYFISFLIAFARRLTPSSFFSLDM